MTINIGKLSAWCLHSFTELVMTLSIVPRNCIVEKKALIFHLNSDTNLRGLVLLTCTKETLTSEFSSNSRVRVWLTETFQVKDLFSMLSFNRFSDIMYSL